MSDCIFCKIVNGDIPSNKVYENDKIIVFKDINPAATIHVLVVPKVHIESLEALTDENIAIIKDIHFAIQKTAKILGVNEKGYRVIINCGEGQIVPHLHYHLLGGTQLT